MKVREVNSFEEMKDVWEILLKKSRVNSNIFLTWEWLSIWWKHFGKGKKPLILLVEDDQKILAIAPLMLSEYKVPFLRKIKKIEFIGTPDSDYHDFIIIEKEKECLKLIFSYIKHNIRNLNRIELKEIKENTGTIDIFRYLVPELLENFDIEQNVCNSCPCITLPNSFESLMSSLKPNMKKNIKSNFKKISEQYDIKFKMFDEAGFTVDSGMRRFVSLHQKKWGAQGKTGSFGGSEGQDFLNFHLDVSHSFTEKGWLGLYFLMANDNPVAAKYAFKYKQKIFCYLTGWDPAYAIYSVGNLSHILLMKEGIKEGFIEYDMMRGDESYKNRWTDTFVRNYEVKFNGKDIPSRFYNWSSNKKTIRRLTQPARS
jgi:CelD/BcsL family acetyltransferase involved in cellulose biosynthesis